MPAMEPVLDSQNIMKIFKAKPGSKLMEISPQFFNNTLQSAVRELAQNARRAGATEFRLTTQPCFTVWDNGPGCEPEDLFDFAGSFWKSDIEAEESPAGIGFWVLARHGAHIRCGRGWEIEALPEHFAGKAEIQARECPPEPGLGLEIRVNGEWSGKFHPSALQYFPFETVIFNGVKQLSGRPFLKEGVEIFKADGYDYQLGIETQCVRRLACRHAFGRMSHQSYYVNLCYSGYQMSYRHDSITQSGGLVCVPEDGPPFELSAPTPRIEVRRESALPLTLPQRDSLVFGPEWLALLERLDTGYLEHAASWGSQLYCTPQRTLEARKFVPHFPFSRYAGMVIKHEHAEDPALDMPLNVAFNWVGRLVTWKEALDMLNNSEIAVIDKLRLPGDSDMSAMLWDAARATLEPLLYLPIHLTDEELEFVTGAQPEIGRVAQLVRERAAQRVYVCTGSDMLMDCEAELFGEAGRYDGLSFVFEDCKGMPVARWSNLRMFIPLYLGYRAGRQKRPVNNLPFYVDVSVGAAELESETQQACAQLQTYCDDNNDDVDSDMVMSRLSAIAMLLTSQDEYIETQVRLGVRTALSRCPADLFLRVRTIEVVADIHGVKVELIRHEQ
jgi:hypothetical protein